MLVTCAIIKKSGEGSLQKTDLKKLLHGYLEILRPGTSSLTSWRSASTNFGPTKFGSTSTNFGPTKFGSTSRNVGPTSSLKDFGPATLTWSSVMTFCERTTSSSEEDSAAAPLAPAEEDSAAAPAPASVLSQDSARWAAPA